MCEWSMEWADADTLCRWRHVSDLKFRQPPGNAQIQAPVRPLLEDDIAGATASLEASTAALERHIRVLQLQQEYFGGAVRVRRFDNKALHDYQTSSDRKEVLQSQQLIFAVSGRGARRGRADGGRR